MGQRHNTVFPPVMCHWGTQANLCSVGKLTAPGSRQECRGCCGRAWFAGSVDPAITSTSMAPASCVNATSISLHDHSGFLTALGSLCHRIQQDRLGMATQARKRSRPGPHLMGAKAAACWRCFAMEVACSMGSTLRRRPPAITIRTICTGSTRMSSRARTRRDCLLSRTTPHATGPRCESNQANLVKTTSIDM